MWNPLFDLLFLEQANDIVDSYLVEIDVAKIALSCHFALDLLCYKEEVRLTLHKGSIGHHCPWSDFIWCGTIATPVTSRYLYPWYRVFSPSLRQQRISSKVETHMLSVWFQTLTGYPNTRSPSTGVLIGLDDANVTCIVTMANANDLATTNTPAPRAIETRITQHKVYE